MLRLYYNFESLWKIKSHYCILYVEVILMKKLKYILAAAAAVLGCCTLSVCAYADTIKVGLESSFKNVASITVSDRTMWVTTESGQRHLIADTYTLKPVTGNYYNIGQYFNSYEQANAKLPAYTGYNCVVALTDRGWTIYVRTDGKKLNNTIIHTGQYCVGFAYNGMYKFVVDSSAPVKVSGSDGTINVGSNEYRDEIEIYRQGSGLTAINVIDEEKYLYGVINSEMPSSWSKEAQKAQAVAARTYMERCKGKHDIYDICDGVHCQAYKGTLNETQAGITAVNETKGLCMYYNNALIEAVYFSSDGGATIDGVEAWGNITPYLIGKADIYEKEYKEWTREFTYSELTNLCSAKGYNVGNVIKVEAQYNKNGIVTGLTFKGSQGQYTVVNDQIRTVFASTSGGSLYSRNFKVISGQETADNTTVGTQGVVTFVGKGNGHGAGMSQYGAKGMAEEGYTYDEILKFYYTDIEIK